MRRFPFGFAISGEVIDEQIVKNRVQIIKGIQNKGPSQILGVVPVERISRGPDIR